MLLAVGMACTSHRSAKMVPPYSPTLTLSVLRPGGPVTIVLHTLSYQEPLRSLAH